MTRNAGAGGVREGGLPNTTRARFPSWEQSLHIRLLDTKEIRKAGKEEFPGHFPAFLPS
jgi:hypothetical protein